MKFELEPDNRGAGRRNAAEQPARLASTLGRAFVTKEEYERLGRWHYATVFRRFGSWNKRVNSLGWSSTRGTLSG